MLGNSTMPEKIRERLVMTRRMRTYIPVILWFLLTGFVVTAQDGRLVTEKVHSPSLEGNLFNDKTDRAVTIYLPPSYDTETDRRYPVVYLVHGYIDTGQYSWINGPAGRFPSTMNSWVKNGKVKEMIVVMPNSVNKFQGSYYANSAATGNWNDYIARDVVEYVDSNYRTLPQRESRGVIGHSMGGYGGMALGLEYPDVFGCMGSMAGPLDLTQYFGRISLAFARASKLKNLSDFYSQGFEGKLAIAVSAAFCANPDNPPFYADFPWVYDDSGKVVKNQDAWDRYMEHDILTRLAQNVDSLRRMRAIYIDSGKSDEYSFLTDARRVHDELNRLNIPHDYLEFPGGHTCCISNSTANALEVFSDAMAFEMVTPSETPLEQTTEPKIAVYPQGKLAATWASVKSQ
jgi:enterochelin esterase-like enzyme